MEDKADISDPRAGGAGLSNRRDELLEALEQLGKARDPKAVHRVRVAARRVRAWLELARVAHPGAGVPLRRARRQVRETARALSGLRDLDVALLHARELRRELETGETTDLRGVNALIDRLKEKRRTARAQARIALRDRRRSLERWLGRLDALSPGASPSDGGATAQADGVAPDWTGGEAMGGDAGRIDGDAAQSSRETWIEDAVRRLLEMLPVALGEGLEPSQLHTLRIAAKKLRYLLEAHGEPRFARLEARLHALQDGLGTLRDWAALESRVTRLHARLLRRGRKAATRSGLVSLEPLLRRRVVSQLERLVSLAGEAAVEARAALEDAASTRRTPSVGLEPSSVAGAADEAATRAAPAVAGAAEEAATREVPAVAGAADEAATRAAPAMAGAADEAATRAAPAAVASGAETASGSPAEGEATSSRSPRTRVSGDKTGGAPARAARTPASGASSRPAGRKRPPRAAPAAGGSTSALETRLDPEIATDEEAGG
jgi:CHAD domain-containing protein